MNIVFESAPEGTTHFLRYASGYIVWCKIDEGQNNQLILSEWDSGNEYWVPGIFPVEHYQKIGLTSIDDLPTQNDVGQDAAAPKGATHRYQHGGETSWYRETEDNLFIWRDGSWYASTQKSAKDLAKVCPFGAVTILTQEVQLADNNEGDLTWLARNVPLEQLRGWVQKVGEGFNIIPCGMPPAILGQPMWFSAREVLSRRAELQNKPSFADHPDAKCFVQSEGGMWWKNTETDQVDPCGQLWRVGDRHEVKNIATLWIEIQKGEVLGDWRDTLEKRPCISMINCTAASESAGMVIGSSSDLSESAVTARLTEATKNVLAAAPELMTDKYKFEPLTSIEDNQELPVSKQQETQQDNGWFERGELPPAGVECTAVADGIPNANCAIIAISTEQVVVKWTENQLFDVLDMPGWSFLPIRTERELAIEEMVIVSGLRVRDGAREVMSNLYDAGYRKETK